MDRWVFRPDVVEDELLTSYLVRTANLHGQNAYRFCAFHLPGVPVWNRDFDRSAPTLALRRIAYLAGLSEEVVTGMTLRLYESGMHAKLERNAIAPWINAAGIYHRTRRRHALQYCPECLAQEAGFKRQWRLSFVVACPQHQRFLQDACYHCGAPVIPHRANVSPVSCHRCGSWLHLMTASDPPGGLGDALKMQAFLLDAVSIGATVVSGTCVDTPPLFSGLRILVLSARERARSRRGAIPGIVGLPSCAVELMRTHHRAQLMARLSGLVLDGPEAITDFCQQTGMTQRQLNRFGPLPSWLSPAASSLPPGRDSNHSSKRSLRRELSRLQRIRPDGWRDRQAQILVDLIGMTDGH